MQGGHCGFCLNRYAWYFIDPRNFDRRWGILGRVAPGGYPPGAPADPYVQDYRIRFLKKHLRFADGTPSERPPRSEWGSDPGVGRTNSR